ncbi:hypothetical protein BpHYR1_049532 [Brachionus plicatilis]|uniref:Uncharacterized protein n=1 Tax=Brachionus plicatilis TaxID=10195 RepID=A0A3M7QPX8_BRAPC|nr:hypothetical protein BpHYR1_049532 [Brachionus plicatilis]
MLSKFCSIWSICSSVMVRPRDFCALAKYNQRRRHVRMRLKLLNNSSISLLAYREPNGDSPIFCKLWFCNLWVIKFIRPEISLKKTDLVKIFLFNNRENNFAIYFSLFFFINLNKINNLKYYFHEFSFAKTFF